MEQENMYMVVEKSRKRKALQEATMALDELNQDMLEKVLSWLPTSNLLRLSSVCKRWKSVTSSPTFHIACSQIPSRDPWFLMVDQDLDQSAIFDCSEHNWKNFSPQLNPMQYPNCCNFVPVASAGGLVCYRRPSGNLLIGNPVSGEFREIPVPEIGEYESLHAIVMYCDSMNSFAYRIVLVLGEFPRLCYQEFESEKCAWAEEVLLVQKADNSSDSQVVGDETLYFLSKAGDVVSTNMQRSPSKQYSSVMTIENGEKYIYFLSHNGNVVACNLEQKTFVEYPRILPVYFEYSIDIVECNGQMLVVVLSEFLETASLRMWKFSNEDRSWQQVAAMPPSMSHEFYGKKVDINCSSSGSMVFICANSSELNGCIMFDMSLNLWTELPKFIINGKANEFTSAFSFQPRLEAVV